MASLPQRLQSFIAESVKEWLTKRSDNPRAYQDPNTLAYPLAAQYLNDIRLSRKRGFISGACAFRDNPHWGDVEIASAGFDFSEEDE